jgi:putative DNA primase/helicase
LNPYDNIPEPLARKPNWVVWGVPGEPQKAPFQPDSLIKLKTVPAISGNPETWGRFETAVRCVEMGIAQGIGYEFDGGGVYGVDLDHVRSDNGKVTPEAQAIVKQLASYTEISPSGHGLHIFVTAEDADITRHRRKGGFVEIYSAGRYFTVTGNVYGERRSIESRSAELQQIHDRYLLPEQARVSPIQQAAMSAVSISDSLSVGLQRDPVLRACYYGE